MEINEYPTIKKELMLYHIKMLRGMIALNKTIKSGIQQTNSRGFIYLSAKERVQNIYNK